MGWTEPILTCWWPRNKKSIYFDDYCNHSTLFCRFYFAHGVCPKLDLKPTFIDKKNLYVDADARVKTWGGYLFPPFTFIISLTRASLRHNSNIVIACNVTTTLAPQSKFKRSITIFRGLDLTFPATKFHYCHSST